MLVFGVARGGVALLICFNQHCFGVGYFGIKAGLIDFVLLLCVCDYWLPAVGG